MPYIYLYGDLHEGLSKLQETPPALQPKRIFRLRLFMQIWLVHLCHVKVPDPGFNNSNKRAGEKSLLSYLFLYPQISQN
jgi:hypothetical protein